MRLVFSGDNRWCLDPSVIVVSRFPNLRHLELGYALDAIDTCPDLPPLQSLIITVRDEDGWPEVMLACNTSLISLKVTILEGIELWEPESIACIYFPKLLSLRIVHNVETGSPWWLEWEAPVLKTFVEHFRMHWVPRMRIQGLESTTVHMRLARPLLLSTPNDIRVLQLDLEFEDFRWFLGQLKENASHCPQLEHLEFVDSNMSELEAAEAANMLSAWDTQDLPNLMHPPTMNRSWSVELPGESEMQVRDQLIHLIPTH
jgi:hypothetical protein